jgi:N-acetylneuraminate synthase
MHNPYLESTKDERFRVSTFPQDQSRFEYWNRTSFTNEEWEYLYSYCEQLDIQFLCTPFSQEAARFLKTLGADSIKLASGDFDNEELTEFAIENFQTIYLSTGFAYVDEIEEKFRELNSRFAGEAIFLQCTSKYPTPLEEVGLETFEWFKHRGIEFGLSDHTGNRFALMAAIAKGARVVEFHVVFSKSQFGPDSTASLTFEEAKDVVEFRNVLTQVCLSSYSKDKISKELQEVRKLFGRALALKTNKDIGEVIQSADLTLKKPTGPNGWNSRNLFVGRRLKRKVMADEHISELDLE